MRRTLIVLLFLLLLTPTFVTASPIKSETSHTSLYIFDSDASSILIKAQSNYYGGRYFKWYITDGNIPIYKDTTVGIDNGEGYYCSSYQFNNLEENGYLIKVEVLDTSGNVVEQGTITAGTTIDDETPPSIVVDDIVIGRDMTTVYVSGEDNTDNPRVYNNNGFAGFKFYLNGAYQGIKYGSHSYFDFIHLQKGKVYTIGIIGFDNALNDSNEVEVVVKIE